MEEIWWTSPLTDDGDRTIIVTGRGDVQKFRSNPKFSIRVEVTIPYADTLDGLPGRDDATLLDEILESFRAVLKADPVAVLTGIYTGAGERNMVFYTLSTNIFNKKLNQALDPFPLLPLKITAENDPDWAEYDEMHELSYIE